MEKPIAQGYDRRTSLTLSRRVGETIRIIPSTNIPSIDIEISEVRHGIIKVTVRATSDVTILRGEVIDRRLKK